MILPRHISKIPNPSKIPSTCFQPRMENKLRSPAPQGTRGRLRAGTRVETTASIRSVSTGARTDIIGTVSTRSTDTEAGINVTGTARTRSADAGLDAAEVLAPAVLALKPDTEPTYASQPHCWSGIMPVLIRLICMSCCWRRNCLVLYKVLYVLSGPHAQMVCWPGVSNSRSGSCGRGTGAAALGGRVAAGSHCESVP